MKKISLRAQRYLAVKLNFYLLALLKFGIFFYLEKPFTFKCNFQTILQFYGLLLCHPTNHRSLMLKVRERWKWSRRFINPGLALRRKFFAMCFNSPISKDPSRSLHSELFWHTNVQFHVLSSAHFSLHHFSKMWTNFQFGISFISFYKRSKNVIRISKHI